MFFVDGFSTSLVFESRFQIRLFQMLAEKVVFKSTNLSL